MIRNVAISSGLVAAIFLGADGAKGADSRDLVEKALSLMGGVEEIVFAVRDLHPSNRPNVTFGEYGDKRNEFLHAPDGSRLCKLNVRTGQITVLRGPQTLGRSHYCKGDRS